MTRRDGGFAERLLCMNADFDVTGILQTIHVPTLVLHARGGVRVPFNLGQESNYFFGKAAIDDLVYAITPDPTSRFAKLKTGD